MKPLRTALPPALACATLLAACGQTGPLYLPEPSGEVITRPSSEPRESEPTSPPPEESQERPAERTERDEESGSTPR